MQRTRQLKTLFSQAQTGGTQYPWSLASMLEFVDTSFGMYTTSGGSTASTVGASVGRWERRGAASDHYTAASSARPTLNAGGVAFDAVDDLLARSGNQARSGVFTVYLVADLNATGNIVGPIDSGGAVTSGGLLIEPFLGVTQVRFWDGGGTLKSKMAGSLLDGKRVYRFRRNASNTLFIAATGWSEVEVDGGAGTASGDLIYGGLGSAVGDGITGSGAEISLMCILTEDSGYAGNTVVESYITSVHGVSL